MSVSFLYFTSPFPYKEKKIRTKTPSPYQKKTHTHLLWRHIIISYLPRQKKRQTSSSPARNHPSIHPSFRIRTHQRTKNKQTNRSLLFYLFIFLPSPFVPTSCFFLSLYYYYYIVICVLCYLPSACPTYNLSIVIFTSCLLSLSLYLSVNH